MQRRAQHEQQDPTDPRAPASPPTRRDWLWAAALFGLALLPRVWRLGAAALWHDEAGSAAMAAAPLREMLRLLPGDGQPPLYYLALHGWVRVFGESEAALRSLSALFGALLAPVLLVAGIRMVGRPAAGVAALLALFASEHVGMSREARMYALLPLLAALTLWAGYGAATRGRLSRHLLWGACAAAMVWTHYWSAYFLVALEVGLLALRRSPRMEGGRDGYWRSWLWGHLLFAALVAPLAPLVLQQVRYPTTHWLAHYPLPVGLYAALVTVAGGRLALLACAAVGGWGLIRAARRPAERSRIVPAALFLATATLLPLILALLVSRVKPSFLPGRYTLAVLPPFCWGVGLLVSALSRAWRAAAAAVLVLTMGLGTVSLLSQRPRSAERDQARRLAAALHPGDVVVYTSLSYSVLHYYLRRAGVKVEEITYPPSLAEHPGWLDDAAEMAHPRARAQEAAGVAERCARRAAQSATIWVAYDDRLRVNAFLESELERRLRLVGGWKTPDLAVCTEFRAYGAPAQAPGRGSG